MPSLFPAEITPNQTPNYHWSPANQRAYLEELAITGVAKQAAHVVSMSKHSAYRLRYRRDGLAFRIGWEAALMIARGRLIDDLMERALEGYEETATRSEDGREITRFKFDTRSAMAMVHRFDKRIDGPFEALPASELAFARIASQDFEAYLDLIETGGAAAQLSLFLAARSDLAATLSGSHLPQIRGGAEEDHEAVPSSEMASVESELTPEEGAAEMSVWFCDHAEGWRTDFPPPPGFYGDEDGEFGKNGYERDLSEEEAEVCEAREEAEIVPLREAGEAARLAWFGLPEKLEDFTQRRGDAEGNGEKQNETSKLCYPRENGGPWSDVALENETGDLPEAQAMDPRFHEDDTVEEKSLADAETKTDIEHKSAEITVRPPLRDPTIRVNHCKPQINYAARGQIPPWAERIY